MSRNKTSVLTPQNRALVTAAEWFAGGQRIWYDPESARVRTGSQAAAVPTALRVFERVAGTGHGADEDAVWLTMLPGFPDGSYGWAQVDRMLADDLVPRLYVEPIGQGDSDKPREYRYSTVERADLVEAQWRHHRVRRTVVVTFDYTSLALLELLRRQVEQAGGSARPVIEAAFMVNGGLFADAHTHPLLGTPLLRTPLGALGMRQWQRSPRAFTASMKRARMYSRGYHPFPEELTEMWSAITRRDGAAFAHNAAGFLDEHQRHADRWDLAAIARDLHGTVALYVGGSDEDPYEHRQIPATRRRVPQVEVLTFPGGHLTTSEHPDLLATEIRHIAARHGVGTPGPHSTAPTSRLPDRPDPTGPVDGGCASQGADRIPGFDARGEPTTLQPGRRSAGARRDIADGHAQPRPGHEQCSRSADTALLGLGRRSSTQSVLP